MTTPIDHQALEGLHVASRLRGALLDLAHRLSRDDRLQVHSLAVFGSAARGEWHEPTSDLNVLFVTSAADAPALDAVREAVRAAPPWSRFTPLLLSAHELAASADTLAVRLDDIRRHHVALIGGAPLGGLALDPGHLRFLIELELRDAALRLRRRSLAHADHRAAGAPLFRSALRSLVPLRALCALGGQQVPDSTPAFLTALAAVVGRDTEVLRDLWELHRSGGPVSTLHLVESELALSRLLLHAVDVADKFETETR